MSSEGEIYLGPTGSESLISNYAKEVKRDFEEIGRSGRTAGGRFKSDIGSRKYTFTIPFEHIDQTALDLLYTKYKLDTPMNLRMYITDSTFFLNFDDACPIVKMQSFSSTDFRTGFSTKLYKGPSVVFIEI